jgi:hypothetical protein
LFQKEYNPPAVFRDYFYDPDSEPLFINMKTHTAMIEITDATYRLAAARLREEIAAADWFNGSMEFSTDGFLARLVLTAIVYRRTEHLPEGVRRPISDVVPVWWEFSTADDEGQCPNDFSFSELKPYLIDYD